MKDSPSTNHVLARLPDGTEYRRWKPPLPLDQGWKLPEDVGSLRARWLALRSALAEAGQLDQAVRRLADHWSAQRVLARPIPPSARTHTSILLHMGVDAAIGASHSAQPPNGSSNLHSEWPTEAGARAAVDILSRPIRQSTDVLPADLAQLHALLCPKLKPPSVNGALDRNIERNSKGRFRTHMALVMGSDRVLKEGAPPEQILSALIEVIRTNARARAEGVAAIVRAAWALHALGVIHPFGDGNGRVARAFASLLLVRAGGFPFMLSAVDHAKYLDAVAAARNGQPDRLVTLVTAAQGLALNSALNFFDQPGKTFGQ